MTSNPATFKRWPPPKAREQLDISAVFSDAEADRIKQGFAPRDMDDRWFVYYEDGWLNFHRSWTGAHIYALKLDGCPFGSASSMAGSAGTRTIAHLGLSMIESS